MSDPFRAEATRLCPTCGAELAQGASFCGACGSLVANTPTEQTGAAPAPMSALASAPTIPPGEETPSPFEAAQREPATIPPGAEDHDASGQVRQNGHRRWDLGRLFRRE